MLLCRDAGLRSGTALRLSAQHLADGGRMIQTRTKNGAQAQVPTTERLRRLLLAAERMCVPDQPLVAAMAGRASVRRQHAGDMLGAAQRRLGLKKRWTFHDLRRTAARELYKDTGDLRKVQALLAHSNLAQSLHYLSDRGVTVDASDLRQRA